MKIKSIKNENKENKNIINEKYENDGKIKNKDYKNDGKIKKLYSKNESNSSIDIMLANDFKSRLVGLMFKRNIEYPLLFEIPQNMNNRYRSSIHSCFMRHELKLVFIDRNNIIYEIQELKPWRLCIPKKEAKYIIEFDKDKFEENLKIGDEIEIR